MTHEFKLTLERTETYTCIDESQNLYRREKRIVATVTQSDDRYGAAVGSDKIASRAIRKALAQVTFYDEVLAPPVGDL